MKKNVLALSIAAMIGGLGFAGVASAAVHGTVTTPADAANLVVNDGGVGHMLLVPYFSAQNGNMSVFHVVNTDTEKGKAVKVRFRSAANSDDILDFQLFLSPGDVWTGAVTAGADGVAQLVTADNSCTTPSLKKGEPQSFITTRLNQKSDMANQTREGYVEIFNMADIPKPAVLKDTLYEAIKHVKGVAPCSVAGSAAATLLNTVSTTDYIVAADAATAGFDNPSGGLMGDWYIINVPQTTTFSGGATAVVAESAPGVSGVGNFVHFPQTEGSVTAIDDFTADPLLRTDAFPADATGALYGTQLTAATVTAGQYDLPDMSTPYTAGNTNDPLEQAALLTKALTVKSITNQYANDATISAKTDWVFSMPTRRYSVAANYDAAKVTDANYRLFTQLAGATPSVEWFTPATTSVDVTNGNICVDAKGQTFYDREEQSPDTPTAGPVFSPSKPGKPSVTQFCGEVSVLAFKDTGASVLGASVARSTVTVAYENGWGVVDTTKNDVGLPVLGASFIKLSNPNVGTGVSGTYGITWPHRFTK